MLRQLERRPLIGRELVEASMEQRAFTTGTSTFTLRAVIADQGEKTSVRFFTFFTDQIPNANARVAHYRNAMRFYAWIEMKRLSLTAIKSYQVSAYLAELAASHSTPSVKQSSI